MQFSDVKEICNVIFEFGLRPKSEEAMKIVNDALSRLEEPNSLINEENRRELDECNS